ncbi:MAG: hypothetical protein ACYDD1_12010 [Caulobacteraceae bacterium]
MVEKEPSELIQLGRASAGRLGIGDAAGDTRPSAGEQVLVQGGHLALSALGGLAYASAFDEDAPVVLSGLLFGAAFYVAAHVVTGPALRVKALEWRQAPMTIGKHVIVHGLFGLLIAYAARRGAAVIDKELRS